MMRVHLINPANPVVSITKFSRWNKLNRYRVWKPLGLLILARLTSPEWDVEVIDENLGPVDYERMPIPDLVGITAFTSQATRAYQIAAHFRARGVPVVMGGIHASMCLDEALRHVDAVVTGEAELKWPRVLEDVKAGSLQGIYEGGLIPIEKIPAARHDLLAGRYYFGSIQTTRGCPLRCNFCSVTAFNGGRFRQRPIENVLDDLRQIREKVILFVDDNLIGTRRDHIAHTKELFRAMIREGLTRLWVCQTTINFADDDELLELAREAGCVGVFIGFESPTLEGLIAVHKKFNIQEGRDFQASVRRIQRHGILVAGSFIMGIDTDQRGIGDITAHACDDYGVDMANVLMLTPLPGTRLYGDMEQQGRILSTNYPEDWQYYTLTHPVATYKNLTWEELVAEMNRFYKLFYSYPKIFRRILRVAIRSWRVPRTVLVNLIANLNYRHNQLYDQRIYSKRQDEPTPAEVSTVLGLEHGFPTVDSVHLDPQELTRNFGGGSSR
jgi:radical SAM superfamily enzyme YgiQ (UPF0313 family)